MPKPPGEDATRGRLRAPCRMTSRISAIGVIMTGPPPIPTFIPLRTWRAASARAMSLSVIVAGSSLITADDEAVALETQRQRRQAVARARSAGAEPRVRLV